MNRRVLIVDDHESWRRHISSFLGKTRGWQVIGEAADGWDAIQRVVALRPDVILLDMEIPGLNGMEIARRIVASDPAAKILFLSAHPSLDIVEAALAAGGRGYVLKMDAGDELLTAMEAIVAGERFLGAVLSGRLFDADAHKAPWARRHEVAFYPDDARLLNGYAGFAKAALTDGASLIFVAPSSRQHDLQQRLRADGVDLDLAIGEGRYRAVDVQTAHSRFMVDGWPDESRFWNAGTALVLGAARASKHPNPRVAACGECAAGLLRDGRPDAAVRLEQLWDVLVRSYKIDVFCGYPAAVPGFDANSDVFQRICREHSAVHSW
jgi:DNA-binding NarL/FixJ family response regulator